MESYAQPPAKKMKEEGVVCKFFSTSEGCRFGTACHFKHSQPSYPKDAMESLSSDVGRKSQPCLKFFSTSGCPYGEGCHFEHYIPGGFSLMGTKKASSVPTMHGQFSTPLMAPASYEPQKLKLCNALGTAMGCRFGSKCHFSHGEAELRNPSSHQALPNGISSSSSLLLMANRDAARMKRREASPPLGSAIATFGVSSTAKISVAASLAGLIIGKGGAHARSICHATGARLSLRDHETDPALKNIEMEGSLEQISLASDHIRELIQTHGTNTTSLGPPPNRNNKKSKMCEKFPLNACTFGDRCHFAHAASELRQNGSKH